MRREKNTSIIAVIANTLLCIAKFIVGILFNSISIISDALNSFTDIIASLSVLISIKVSSLSPDKKHQFGHTRSQPIAGLIVAIFTSIVGFEVIVSSIMRIIDGKKIIPGLLPIIIIIIVIITKFLLYIDAKDTYKHSKGTAIKALYTDHRNDVLVSSAVLIGVILSSYGYPIFDPIVAIIVGVYIIWSGFDIGKENIRYLMGEAPTEDMFNHIESLAASVPGVIGIHDIRAHLLGTVLEVEVHIYVDKTLNIQKAHDIGKRVQNKLEKQNHIIKAYIHIDPFHGRFKKKRKF